jgi:hypothetical protein
MGTYNKQYPWPNGWAVARRLYAVGGGPGVEPRGLPHFTQSTINQPMSDTWRPWVGPRVLILFAHKRTRVSTLLANNRPMKTCHIIHLPCHRTDGTALPRHRTDCRDRYSQHPKILSVWLGEQITITSPYGLCLRK